MMLLLDNGVNMTKRFSEAQIQEFVAKPDIPVTMAYIVRQLMADRDAAIREADRLRHGVPVEGDFVCPDALLLDEARKAVLLLHKMLCVEP